MKTCAKHEWKKAGEDKAKGTVLLACHCGATMTSTPQVEEQSKGEKRVLLS